MSPSIKANYEADHAIGTVSFEVNSIPDSCPLCHQGIVPIERFGWFENRKLVMIFQCPKKSCRSLFLAFYYKQLIPGPPPLKEPYQFRVCLPWKVEKKVFPGIMKIFPTFIEIYNQAKEAEERGLKEICGAGYRKALEFLIKNYLIRLKGRKPSEIRETWLGTCIDKYIDSPNIKDCAKRAVWLGNDETHYIRKWKNKDLEDLKDLIELTVNWIHDEHLTKRIKKEMPSKKRSEEEEVK